MKRRNPKIKQRLLLERKKVAGIIPQILSIVKDNNGLTIDELYNCFPPDGFTQWCAMHALDKVTGYIYREDAKFGRAFDEVMRTGCIEIQKDVHGGRRLVMREKSEDTQPFIMHTPITLKPYWDGAFS